MMMYYLLSIFVISLTAVSAQRLSEGKPVTQSSVLKDNIGSLAVDGNFDTDFAKKSCFHSKQGDRFPWWMVDLQNLTTVGSVTIYNRGDCCGARLRNIKVLVYSKNPETHPTAPATVCNRYRGPGTNGEVVEIKCRKPVFGRFIRITKVALTQDDVLSFCEVTVKGVCPSYMIDIDGECLNFITSYTTFSGALTLCEKMDAELAMLKTKKMDDAVKQYIQENQLQDEEFYIGVSNMMAPTQFRWVDGSVVLSFWKNSGQTKPQMIDDPDHTHCGFVTGDESTWRAWSCSQLRFFICQMKH